MSDEDDFSESDFSASEEEWVPNKNAIESESDDEDDPDPDPAETETPENSTVKTKGIKNRKRTEVATLNISKPSKKLKRKSGSNANSLRSKMFKKYQPPPKVINAPKLTPGRSTPSSVARITTKKLKKPKISDESSSSGDEALVNPKDLDLKSSFFDVGSQVKPQVPCEPPNFDCNGGMIFSESEEEDENDGLEEINDSDDDDQDDDDEDNANKDKHFAESPFKNFYDYHQKVEEAKDMVKKFENQNSDNSANGVDITSLLAMGEAGPSQKHDRKIKKNRTKNHDKICDNSDSDWEQVKENEKHNGTSSKDNNDVLEIIVEHPKLERYQKKKCTDEEASLMRKLNRVIKENQLVKHKASLLCQIAHGNYLNRTLNTPKLMKQALKLLPNGDKSYPNGKTEVAYFESITKWFSAKFKIKNYEMYSGEKNRNYLQSLENQIGNGEALSKKDFVLIFIILLRAMGIQCRMVMNLVTIPLRPVQADLCTIKQKKPSLKPVSNKRKAAPKKKNALSGSFRIIEEKVIKTPEKKEPRIIQPSDVFDEVLHKVSKYPLPTKIVSSELISAKEEEICQVSKKKKNVKTQKDDKTEADNKTKADNKTSQNDKTKKDQNKFRISPLFMLKQENSTRNTRSQAKRKLLVPQMDGADDILPTKKKRTKTEAPKKSKKLVDSDDDFVNPPPKSYKTTTASNKLLETVKKIDRRVLSTDDENILLPINKKKNAMDIWIEVYCEADNRWITIDLFHTKVNCVESLKKQATSPVSYVFAWNNDISLKDVSPRYCSEWNTVTRINRVEKEWLDQAIQKYLGKKTKRDIIEDKELDKIHLDKPLPTTINEFKNHPLYALKRHLLKFEVLYPSTAPTLGFVRGEPIYPRDCVHLCHSREIWLKEARVVRPGEKPYKIVKARPKWDRLNGTFIKDLPLEIFGYWQTIDYEPPTAENGIVPRNAYGNVELFKMCMLPKKTVHLRLNGLQKVCKKLKVDCAPAVIGFDFNQGNCHPMYDGFIVCEEFHDEVVAAWYTEQEEAEKRETEKYEQRVYGNWKKLIKGLYIRQKLKLKYNFEDIPEETLSSLRKKLRN